MRGRSGPQVVFPARGTKRAHDFSVGAGLDAKDTFLGQVGPNTPANSVIAQIGGVWQRTATAPSCTPW
ncbi:hypothetical protein ACFY9S_02455 [Streptomyces sp. NPDC012474]|uniref:hypothetical protein n=1 Tax=Streptomyces sp. NPDC012474 TaxID=3364836 RepID=UPI0036E5C7FB